MGIYLIEDFFENSLFKGVSENEDNRNICINLFVF